jgi:peptidoglycan/LPS O-acetylase OafA/YrhL
VQVFFVLSGYLITSLLLRELDRTSTISLREFYIRRSYRIFPAAFLFLAVVIAVYWHQMRWYHIAAAVLYVANMDLSRPWVFGHLWSLSIEEQFYLLWPFALKKWHRHKTAILIAVLVFSPICQTFGYAFKVQNALMGSLPVRADQLAVGCLLAIFATRLPRIGKGLAAFMLVVVILVTRFPATSAARTLFMLFCLRPLLDVSIAGLVLHVIQSPYRLLNWAPVAWLGKISYGVYLWQELLCANPSLNYGYWLILPTLACACLSYYLLEKPMLRVRDRQSAGRSHPVDAVNVREATLAPNAAASS